MMARPAGLYPDQAGRELAEEWDHLRPFEGSTDDNLTRAADRVDLKDALGQIEADSSNLRHGWLQMLVVCVTPTTMALRRREREPSTPSANGQGRVARPRGGRTVVIGTRPSAASCSKFKL